MAPIEILAPAGGPAQARAAILNGADAIYLGAKQFSARSGAQNFDEEELGRTVDDCHGRGVKVYLALNTLLRQSELPRALEVVRQAYRAGIDALIVQDLGLVSLVRRAFPDLPLHGSTQMSIHSPAGARQLARLGFSRAILARELSLKEIAAIAREGALELEVFIHGALCMSVSGQCLMSAVIGGRSGNRGDCAGTCRLPFCAVSSPEEAAALPGGAGDRYDLSLKDLCGIDHLPQLQALGVASVKIEGRLKRPEYVGQVTAAIWRARAGQGYDKALLQDLFSRSGFTDGYLTGTIGPQMFGHRREADARASQKALDRLATEPLFPRRERGDKLPLRAHFTLRWGEGLTLTARCGEARAQGSIPAQEARAKPTGREALLRCLEKTGDTPFSLAEGSCEVEEGLFVPVSACNALRRQVYGELAERCAAPAPARRECPVDLPACRRGRPARRQLAARFESVAQLLGAREAWPLLDEILLPLRALEDRRLAPFLDELLPKLTGCLPRLLFTGEGEEAQRARRWAARGLPRVEGDNLAHLELLRGCGAEVTAGPGLSCFSGPAALALQEMGAVRATLSPEVQAAEIAQFPQAVFLRALGYGRLPVMNLRACPLQNRGGCAACRRTGGVVDRTGRLFPLLCQGGWSQLLNCLPLDMGDRRDALALADSELLWFTVEAPGEIAPTIHRYAAGQRSTPQGGYTRGLYFRAV